MDTNLILTTISIATTSIVGVILYKQIKSQKEIIEKYKEYIETIDVKKFNEYVEIIEKTNETKLEHEQFKHKIEFEKYDEKKMKLYSRDCTELTRLVCYFFNKNDSLTREEKLAFISKALPSTGHVVSKFIKE